jgi:hypothetical protein
MASDIWIQPTQGRRFQPKKRPTEDQVKIDSDTDRQYGIHYDTAGANQLPEEE